MLIVAGVHLRQCVFLQPGHLWCLCGAAFSKKRVQAKKIWLSISGIYLQLRSWTWAASSAIKKSSRSEDSCIIDWHWLSLASRYVTRWVFSSSCVVGDHHSSSTPSEGHQVPNGDGRHVWVKLCTPVGLNLFEKPCSRLWTTWKRMLDHRQH